MSCEPSFETFLKESFVKLAGEVPEAHWRLCGVLAGRRVELRVDGEPTHLDFGREAVRWGREGGEPHLRVVTSRATVLDLVDGETTVLDAVLAGRLEIIGDVGDVLAFDEGLSTFVHGAIRAPAFPPLLRRYRGAGPTGSK